MAKFTRFVLAASAAVALMPASARCGTGTADISGGAAPEGWTAVSGGLASPEYPGPVTRISFSYSAEAGGTAALFARTPGCAVEFPVASGLNGSSRNASFEFDAARGFVSFRLAFDGSFSPGTFTADWTPAVPDAPENVAVADWTPSSVSLSWSPSAGAAGYELLAWTNVVTGASPGTAVWTETFAGAKTGGTGALGDDAAAESFDKPGWEWPDKLYRADADGAVRIGTTAASGRLVSPPLPAGEGLHLRIAAKCSKTSPSPIILQLVRGAATNDIGSVVLASEWTACHAALPALEDGDRIIVNSVASGDRRVAIDEFSIVSGYSAGEPGVEYLRTVRAQGGATAGTIDGLPPVPVFIGVRALGPADGAKSAISDGIEVDLSHAPVKAVSILGCGGAYSQDFSSAPAVQAAWTNRLSLAGCSAFYGADAVSLVRKFSPGATSGGLYGCSTNVYAASPALGLYSSKEKTASFEIAFTNDTGAAQSLAAVRYSAQQWGTRNKNKDQRLRLTFGAAGAADADRTELHAAAPMVSEGAAAGDSFPFSVPVATAPEGLVVPPGETWALRWTLDKATDGSALMAIDGVEVEFVRFEPKRFIMRVAEKR